MKLFKPGDLVEFDQEFINKYTWLFRFKGLVATVTCIKSTRHYVSIGIQFPNVNELYAYPEMLRHVGFRDSDYELI